MGPDRTTQGHLSETYGVQPPPDTSRADPGENLGAGVTELGGGGIFVIQHHCSNS